MSFDIPQIRTNSDSWGPTNASIPHRFAYLAHTPFTSPPSSSTFQAPQQQQQQQQQQQAKHDFRLGKTFDFVFNSSQTQQQHATRVQRKKDEEQTVSDDEEEFSVVTSKKGGARGGRQWSQSARGGQRQMRGGFKRGRGQYYRRTQGRYNALSKPSIEVRPSWELMQTFTFPELGKVSVDVVPAATDLETAGFVEWFDEKYNQSTVKKPLPILKPSRLVFSTTTSDDPIIAELAEKINAEEQGPVTTVYATDFLLAVLMSAPRSVYSWDLVLTKKGNTITIDKRESSDLDLLTVDETSKDPPLFSDSKNSNTNYAQQLHQEATRLNMAFQEQVLKKAEEREYFARENPFQDEYKDDQIAAIGYKYRQWKLGKYLNVVARCQVDGIDKTGAKDQFLTIRCINEYEAKEIGDWKSKLETQRGAIFMNELRNNINKFTRWTVQALLGGSNQLKLGYVSRSNLASGAGHSILSIDSYLPLDFAKQIEMNIRNIWGIVKTVADQVNKYDDGKYVLLKEPNKNLLQLYSIPNGETVEGEVEDADVSDSEEQNYRE